MIKTFSGGSRGAGGTSGLYPPFLEFLFTKAKFTSKKVVLNEYEICLKMLEMAILETQIFKKFLGSMRQHPPEGSCLQRSLVHPPPPPSIWKS